jgi:nicotinamide riboside kinase
VIRTHLEPLDAREAPYEDTVIVEPYVPWAEADDHRSLLAEEARYEARRDD